MKKVNIVIVGGGSTWTPGLLSCLVKFKKQFPVNELTLYDIDEERQSHVGRFGEVLYKQTYPELKFKYTTNKDEAFNNVDFVFCQMRTGGLKMREQDEKIPLKLGMIGQETCGPGGFAYGMRSIRDMIELVEDVRSRSKDAWILNYTNPAAIVAVALNMKFPEDKRIINICDQPVNLMKAYGKILKMDYREFEPKYFGLNHFGWFTNLYDKDGNDLVPKLRSIILEKGFAPEDAEQRDASWLETYGMVKTMLEDFPDYLPNTYLQYYLYPEYKLSKLDPNYTRANEVMDGREKRVFAECDRVAQQGNIDDLDMVHNDAHADMIVELAMSIFYNQRKTFITIQENNGAINNLPDDAMVELASSVGANGCEQYHYGNIETFYKGFIENQYAFEKLTAEAYFENSYQKALQALTLNRMVNSTKKARLILDALIEANGDYFPELR